LESGNGWGEQMRKGRWVPVVAYALLLLAVASLPGSDLQRIQAAPENLALRAVLSDPFMHALTFGLFSLLLAWGLASRGRPAGVRVGLLAWRLAAVAALPAVGFGLLIELYQALLPWRAFGIDDLAWNAVGVVLCLAGLGIGGVVRGRLGIASPPDRAARNDEVESFRGGEA
jgi:hypothetical protein